MTTLSEIKGTVSARLIYEEDFTFAKKREELAQVTRSEIGPRISGLLGGMPAKVSIDSDGDIVVRLEETAYIYLTKASVTCSALNVNLAQIHNSNTVSKLPDVAAELHSLRSSYLKPISYGARLYATFWYPTAQSIESLRARNLSFLIQVSEGKITDESFSCSYDVNHFSDTFTVDTKAEQVAVRLIRDANAASFADDFIQFWHEARIWDTVRKFAPFFEPLERQSAYSGLSSLLGTSASK